MKKKKRNVKKKEDNNGGALFIPAGVLLGMGFGFVYGNIPAGFFIGLGLGFVAFAIITLLKNKRR